MHKLFFLEHKGVKRRSGRWPWGSGENPYQHEWWFTWSEKERKYREDGLTDAEIAKMMGIKATELRSLRSVTNEKRKAAITAEAYRLYQKGVSKSEIARRFGVNESNVRSWLKRHETVKQTAIENTAEMLKSKVSKDNFLDVGSGTELYLGVSETRKNAAVQLLKEQGYTIHYIKTEQQFNPKHYTYLKVLAPPGTPYNEVNKNREKINPIEAHTTDNGKTWLDIYPPQNISSSRVLIRYGDEGGKNKDGVIELRRNVEDLSLGKNRYAQVRIAVDGTHYLKGMALYSDSIPDGYDIVYNTNKKSGTPKEDVFKPQNIDKSTGEVDLKDPFGAVLRAQTGQTKYVGKDGKEHLSAINIVNQEGDWENYKKHISSQVLSKQDISLARSQLTMARQQKEDEFREIMSLTNPTVKKAMLKEFADTCDSSAVHLKAAALPRQAARVILPLTHIKENEVYAPGYKTGEKVVLIRHPHGGKFEIPELIVNNNNRDGIRTISNKAKDAIGIHPSVAEKLSGADFDGDSVIVIPNNKGYIKTAPSLEGLKNFDPKESYPAYPGMPKVTKKNFNDQRAMGEVSNLITDMTLKGATPAEIARAVRHSMVVIDAVKHNLDYKTSYEDNGIAQLKKQYQGRANAGASTLISKAKSPVWVNQRSDVVKWDPKTGEKIYTETGATRTLPNGKVEKKKQESTKMAEARDAYELSSGTAMEGVYADYANSMKSLANKARLAYMDTKPLEYSPSAYKTYSKEVSSLTSKLNVALKNAPLNRKANMVAEMVVKAKIEANPDLASKENKKEVQKLRTRAFAAASARYNTTRKEKSIQITEKEWEAIQAGAFSSSKLSKILEFTDSDLIKSLATPRSKPSMSSANVAAARAMLNRGYTQAEVAQRFGISVSTLISYME